MIGATENYLEKVKEMFYKIHKTEKRGRKLFSCTFQNVQTVKQLLPLIFLWHREF